MDTYCPYCMNPASLDGNCPHCGKHPADYQPSGHHFPPGKLLHDRYLVGRVLGEGGFGITYLGRDTLLNYRVAVKEYFPNQLVRRDTASTMDVMCHTNVKPETFTKFRKRFLDEARVMASLQNIPEIVRVTDFFLENSTAYIVMELLEGETLETLLSRQSRIPAPELLSLLKPLMKAMQKMHDAGIIHRDVSPNNIMVQPDGKVKLLDFGCARDFDEQGTMTVMLKHGYAPVEQYDGHGQGPWTDVYALSAVIYRALTGKVPPPAIKRTRAHDPLEPPNQKGAALSPVQEKALLKGLAVEPGDRCQSISNLYAPLYGETIGGFDWSLDMDEEPSEAEKREQERKRQEVLKRQELEEARRRKEEEQARQKEEARQRKAAAAQKKEEERRRKAEEREARRKEQERQRQEKAQARQEQSEQKKTEMVDETDQPDLLEKWRSIPKQVKIGAGAAAAVLIVLILAVALRGLSSGTTKLTIGGQSFYVNQQTLNLSNAGLRDISTLREVPQLMELTELFLAENEISDVSPLSGLTSLTILNLRENQIEDVSPLKSLTNLERLVLDGNPISAEQLAELQAALPKCTIISDVKEISIAGETFSTSATELDLSEKALTDITTLSFMRNLTKLDLWKNQITDISSLNSLTNLESLMLRGNQISDISVLNSLTNLEYLNLVANQISDISPLSSLTNLETLALGGNQISDISALSGLTTLQKLRLESNDISDISALSSLTTLQELALGSNDISDFSVLSGLTNLTDLALEKSQISDISVLSGLTTLQDLWLEGNDISDISALSGLTNLENLGLGENQISDISVLSGLTTLEKLWLESNAISDISALSGLTNLTELDLSGNPLSAEQVDELRAALPNCKITFELESPATPASGSADSISIADETVSTDATTLNLNEKKLTDISALSRLSNLKELHLHANSITDITPLSGLTNLQKLWLGNNDLSDISALSGLTNLEVLRLFGNDITDISPLSGLTNLTSLYLESNKIRDISALKSLTNLTELKLGGNLISADQLAELRTALPNCEIKS